VVGLEELYLANLIVRKGLAPPEEVRAALEALDRIQGKTDFVGRLGQRFPQLGQPDIKEKAAASAARYLLAKREMAFAARIRATGAVPPAVLDAVVAEQKGAGLAWTLADRLVKDGKLSTVRCALLQKEAAAELKKQEDELLKKHRSTKFQETVTPGTSVSGRRTAEYSLETSSEGLVAFGMQPGPAPASSAPGGGDDAGEATMKLPQPVASGLQPLGDGVVATVMLGRGDAVLPDSQVQGDMTIKLPAPQKARPAPAAPPGPLAIGSSLAGKYQIKAELGRGGMGVVYRAPSKE
jgi:hypothetical protein